MLTKEKLKQAAKEAKTNNAHVYIINSNEGIKIVNITVNEYNSEKVNADPNIIKVMQPDSILKYDWSTWEQRDVSIDTLVDGINLKYGKRA